MEIAAYIFKVVVPVIITIGLAFFLMRFIEGKIRGLSKKKDFSEANVTILKLIIRWIIIIVTTLVVATIFGIELTVLWTTISVLLGMIVFGLFAGWSIISSFLATIIIMVWRPYKVGDNIELLPDGIKGKVVEMSMMFSELKDENEHIIRIPNSMMLQKIIKKI